MGYSLSLGASIRKSQNQRRHRPADWPHVQRWVAPDAPVTAAEPFVAVTVPDVMVLQDSMILLLPFNIPSFAVPVPFAFEAGDVFLRHTPHKLLFPKSVVFPKRET